jgi:catechol 2,3-dioxygenase-like lactoylglutathione lyase family enzyme
MSQSDQNAELKFVVTNTLIVRDIQSSVAFYRDVLGATVLREGEPTFLRLGNVWLTINRGGVHGSWTQDHGRKSRRGGSDR